MLVLKQFMYIIFEDWKEPYNLRFFKKLICSETDSVILTVENCHMRGREPNKQLPPTVKPLFIFIYVLLA